MKPVMNGSTGAPMPDVAVFRGGSQIVAAGSGLALLDSGGPLARFRGERPYPDFAFSQQLSPELAPPGWRPKYVDYLILGLTTSTAFSPTDTMPLTSLSKVLMGVQSLASLVTIGLVVARAVNWR